MGSCARVVGVIKSARTTRARPQAEAYSMNSQTRITPQPAMLGTR